MNVWGVFKFTGDEVGSEGHEGHEAHNHAAHAGITKCECGAIVGSYSFIPSEEDTGPCPVCEAS